jgi:hypothetical protein
MVFAKIPVTRHEQERSVKWAFSFSSGLVRATFEEPLFPYHNTFLLALS